MTTYVDSRITATVTVHANAYALRVRLIAMSEVNPVQTITADTSRATGLSAGLYAGLIPRRKSRIHEAINTMPSARMRMSFGKRKTSFAGGDNARVMEIE